MLASALHIIGAWAKLRAASKGSGAGPQLRAAQEVSHPHSSLAGADATAPGYVAACLVIRDQHGDILEWVAHHLR